MTQDKSIFSPTSDNLGDLTDTDLFKIMKDDADLLTKAKKRERKLRAELDKRGEPQPPVSGL